MMDIPLEGPERVLGALSLVKDIGLGTSLHGAEMVVVRAAAAETEVMVAVGEAVEAGMVEDVRID